MTTTRRPLTDRERDARRAEQRALVTAAIEQLRSSEGWQAYLKGRARFRAYSARNVLMILQQHPTAERVAGFRAWLALGYCPVKGSRAIRIWAPCPPSKSAVRKWRDAGADPEAQPRTCWRLASVFAQDQVAELPPPAVPAPLQAPVAEITGDSHERLITRLTTLADEIGYTVQITDTGAADGTCHPGQRTIRVADRLAPNGRLVALIHELAHALVSVDDQALELDYAEGELIAESVAWTCCQTVGLDSSANSIPYLASWAEQASLDVLERAAALTGRLADRIERVLLDDELNQDSGIGPVRVTRHG
jgi:antirestriction protein ArdC